MKTGFRTITVLFVIALTVVKVHAEEESMSEEELAALLSGKTVRGLYLDQNKSFVRYYDEDGAVRQRADNELIEGEWFINEQGRRCIVWSNKEKHCRVVVRDNELYKEFTVQKDGKRKLVVIYRKVVDGNPDGL